MSLRPYLQIVMGLYTFKSFHEFKNWRMTVIKHARKLCMKLSHPFVILLNCKSGSAQAEGGNLECSYM
jgi:hypothetical protein